MSKLEIAKTVAIKVAPVLLGVLLGVGGTNAVTTKTEAKPVTVICKCDHPPLKAELIFPKK